MKWEKDNHSPRMTALNDKNISDFKHFTEKWKLRRKISHTKTKETELRLSGQYLQSNTNIKLNKSLFYMFNL